MATLTDTTPRGHRAWQSRLQGKCDGIGPTRVPF
jgi:hypothetical protein